MNSAKMIFGNLKSDYFLKELFSYMKKNKSLEIIKNNKKLQKRSSININDYKEYFQYYTPIEIELTIVDNKYGKFINISEEVKKYYHIYFDNSKEEIHRNILNDGDKVKIIKIIIDYQIKSFKKLFSYCNCICSIFFKKFYRIDITDMSSMFFLCYSLKELNFYNFNTDNVIDMSMMFSGCKSLKKMNLSNFNTNHVTNMYGMFSACASLKELNLSNFNTNNVTNMNGMFDDCESIKELDSDFDTNNVTDMNCLFRKCSSLNKLNITITFP